MPPNTHTQGVISPQPGPLPNPFSARGERPGEYADETDDETEEPRRVLKVALRSGIVDISTPPTTPSPTSPLAHSVFGFALPTPPHTPPRSTPISHSRSHSFPAIPSPTSEFRYANSTFQHSPRRKSYPVQSSWMWIWRWNSRLSRHDS